MCGLLRHFEQKIRPLHWLKFDKFTEPNISKKKPNNNYLLEKKHENNEDKGKSSAYWRAYYWVLSKKKRQFTKFGRVFDLLQNGNAIVLKSWYVVEEVRFS